MKNVKNYYEESATIRNSYELITGGTISESEILGHCILILKMSHTIDVSPRTRIWGDDIEHYMEMPRDTFCDLIKTPTHLAISGLIYGYVHSNLVREFEPIVDVLKEGLIGALKVGFLGHGYDAEKYLIEILDIYKAADVEIFLQLFGDMNIEFKNCFRYYENGRKEK